MIYFAYGSNLDPEQIRRRCPQYKVLGRAFLPGYALCFPRRSPVRQCATAGIERAMGKGVWGVLYEVTEDDALRLHAAEGYAPGLPAELNAIRSRSWTSGVADPKARRWRRIPIWRDPTTAAPSGDYLGHLLWGAEHHRLPQAYVIKLRAIGAAAIASTR